MKKAIYILVITIILAGVIAGNYFYNSLLYIETYHSPDGNYELIVKREGLGLFTSTMPGDGGAGSSSVVVILKSADGKVIGTSNNIPNGNTIMDSISVEWDIENDWVWYGRGKAINLKTGK